MHWTSDSWLSAFLYSVEDSAINQLQVNEIMRRTFTRNSIYIQTPLREYFKAIQNFSIYLLLMTLSLVQQKLFQSKIVLHYPLQKKTNEKPKKLQK